MFLDLLILLVTVWLTHFLIAEMRKPKNFPNGPIFYPIIGNLLTVDKLRKETGFLIRAVMKIAERYSNTKDVIGLKIGKDLVVFTMTTKALKEVYTCSDFDGRPFGPFYETRTWNKRLGIIFTDQEFFQAQHRFIVRQLKEFGFARKGMLEICENEAEFCLNDFRKMIENHGGKSATVNMPNILTLYILNTLWQFLAGIRYDVDNQEMRYLQGILSDLMKSIDMKGALFSHFPFLQYIAPEASGYKNYMRCHKNIHAFMRKEVERHKRNFNPSDEPRDLIEAYLKVLHVGDESGKAHKSFSELQLLGICLDMFIAGSETTNNASNFMMLYLTRNPHVQIRAREEIDRVIGRNRLPKLSDRPNLPYCEAIVHESLRSFMKMACGVPHRALKDTKLCGFDIPKDTMIISSFMPPSMDTKSFKNPHKFDPENFLDENGNVVVPENFIPFALGKRRCIGEVLARTNLFLLCTTLLQNFYIEIPDGHDMPSEEPIDSMTPNVRDYEATIVLRQ